MQQRMSAVTVPVITVAAVAVSIVTAFVGSGAVGGTPISQAAGGAFSSDGTPLSPAGPAFSIWSVQLGLVAGSVVVIVALLLVLIRMLLLLHGSSGPGPARS